MEKIVISGVALSKYFALEFSHEIFKLKRHLFFKVYIVMYWLFFLRVLLSKNLTTVRTNYSQFYLFAILSLIYISYLFIKNSKVLSERFVTMGLGAVVAGIFLSILSVLNMVNIDYMFFNIAQTGFGLTLGIYAFTNIIEINRKTIETSKKSKRAS